MNGEYDRISVFIVAASPITRAGLESVLRTDEKLIVAGSAAEMPPAPAGFSSGCPVDVFLVNVEREREFVALSEFLSDGGEEANLSFVVAILSDDFQIVQPIELLRIGVRGILPFAAAASEISAAINAASNNLIAVPPEILEALVSSISNENFSPGTDRDLSAEPVESLTAREREVLEMLAEGASNKTIADRLNISEHTVKFHVASVFGKLGVNSRTEAVTQALRSGLILL